jgi:DNA polymerase III subunit delta'
MKFADVIGQQALKARLIKTVRDNRVSHGQLFIGQEGSGNLALAIAYAQYINCTSRTDNDSCGVCPSCVKYNKLAHPDLHFVFPSAKSQEAEASAISIIMAKWRAVVLENNAYLRLTDWYEKLGIEKKQAIISSQDCNNIIKTLSYRSYEADYQVVIIWMVEKLFHAAAPKLLKILEEPPEKTLFILVSSNQDQILKTILSRTQIVKIPAIEEDELKSRLLSEFGDPSQVHDAVRISQGNYIEAKQHLSKLEEGDWNLQWFTKWMRLCFGNRTAETLDFSHEISKQSRDRQKNFLIYALRMLRQSLFINTGNDDLARLNAGETDFVVGKDKKHFYPYVHLQNAGLITDEINDSIYHIERNGNSYIIFFDLSLRLGTLLKMQQA